MAGADADHTEAGHTQNPRLCNRAMSVRLGELAMLIAQRWLRSMSDEGRQRSPYRDWARQVATIRCSN